MILPISRVDSIKDTTISYCTIMIHFISLSCILFYHKIQDTIIINIYTE